VIILTAHAIEQYATRFGRLLTHAEARSALEEQLPRAARDRRRSSLGDSLWRLPDGAFLVTRRDGPKDIAVTVLRESDLAPSRGVPEEEMALALERVDSASCVPASLTLAVHVEFTRGTENVEVVRSRIEGAVLSLLGNMRKNPIAGATVTALLVERVRGNR
jgi:hypothetical protein